MASVAASLLLVLAVVAPVTTYAATFPVVWDLTTDYSAWASKDISVGDQLVFSYDLSHSVLVVSESDYASCVTSNPSSSDNSGKTTHKLTAEGAVYFICGTSGHCPPMKLQVNVKASSTSPTPASPASPPASATTPTTPSSPPPPTTSSNNNAAAPVGITWLVFVVSLIFGTLFTFVC